MAKKKKDESPENKGDGEADAPKIEGADGAEGAVPEETGGKSKKKLIIFIAAPLLLLIVAGAGLYFTGMLDGLLGKKAPAAEGEADAGADAAPAEEGGKEGKEGEKGAVSSAFLAIPPMIVNLNSDDGTPRFLRLTVQLELNKPGERSAVEAVIPRVIDQFQTYLRELKVQDLQGSAGIYRLQMELLWRVNQAAAPAQIKNVLFQEILIQ